MHEINGVYSRVCSVSASLSEPEFANIPLIAACIKDIFSDKEWPKGCVNKMEVHWKVDELVCLKVRFVSNLPLCSVSRDIGLSSAPSRRGCIAPMPTVWPHRRIRS